MAGTGVNGAASVAKPSGGGERSQTGHDQNEVVAPAVEQVAAPNESAAAGSLAQTEQPDPYKLRDLIAQEDMAYWAMGMFFAALATFIVTSIGTFLIWRQVKLTRKAVEDTSEATEAMREANEIAERTAHRQLRPYLWVEASWFEMQENGEPLAHIHLKNYGQTPALSASGWTHTWIDDYPLKDALPEPEEGSVDMGSVIIGPGQTSESRQPHGVPIGGRSLQWIMEETAALYCYGYGHYLDTFGKEHYYRFIYFSNGERFKRGRFTAYNSGNIIDAE